MMERDDQELDQLFAVYRRACPTPEPSSAFMPRVWERIDQGLGARRTLQRWTRGFVAAATTACLLMVLYMAIPRSNPVPIYGTTYVDALSDNASLETLAYSDMVAMEPVVVKDNR